MTTLDRFDLSYVHAVKTLKTRLAARAVAAFRSGEWRDADADRFVATAVPLMLAGERAVASLTDAWLSRRLSTQLERRVTPGLDTRQVTGRAARDVDPDQMWRRPYVKVRTDLSEGTALDAAVQAGATLIGSLVSTNLQLARTHTARAVLSSTTGVVGYRRVLTGSVSCALCYVASTQRYRKRDLLPIHPGCDCTVEPIIDTDYPGRVLDPETLEGTHEAIADRFGTSDRYARAPDYRKAMIVEEHGELGPVLAVKSHRFTTL